MTDGRLAVLTAYGEPFEVREYPVPDPGPGSGTGYSRTSNGSP